MTLPSNEPTTGKQVQQEEEIQVTAQAVIADESTPDAEANLPTIATAVPLDPTKQSSSYASQAPGRSVEVIAPTAMMGGYQFFVDVGNNTSLKVEVPAGGVQQGERFQARVIEEASASEMDPHRVPGGRWRDGLCDCCTFGCCHPVCCLTFWCTACSLGQVLTRLKLNWCVQPNRSAASSAFSTFVAITVVYLVLSWSLGAAVSAGGGSSWEDNEDDEDDPSWVKGVDAVRTAVEIAFWLLILVTAIRTRIYIRQKYSIREECCPGCEDCCCSFWCLPCTVCQMSRHTADYHRHGASCCTPDGLSHVHDV